VQRYLEEVITDCGAANERSARLILYLLTDKNGTRPLKTHAELKADLSLSSFYDEINKLDLVLEILVGSQLVVIVPDYPEKRYQLVHDYLVSFIHQQQSPQVIAELDKEREQRKIAEATSKILNQVLRQQLRTALSSLLSMTILAIMNVTAITGITLHLQQEIFQNELEQKAELLLDTLIVYSRDSLYFLDKSFMKEYMEELGEDQVLVAGQIYNKEGQVLADAFRHNVLADGGKPDPLGKELVESNEIVFKWQSNQLIAGKAIILGRQRLGAVSVGLSTAPLKAKMAAVRNQGIAIAILTAMIGTLVALLMSKLIRKPLQEMNKSYALTKQRKSEQTADDT